ncbi:MAG: DUF1080 domain-containing protein [Verrucomicrobiota bacterium]
MNPTLPPFQIAVIWLSSLALPGLWGAEPNEVVSLFDGETLGHWEPIPFGGEGHVHVSFDGWLTLENGNPFTGVVWKGPSKELPHSNYEISFEAIKHYGDDFFCGLTLPVGDSSATLICGGWGGVIVGLSSIDEEDASLNETSTSMSFTDGQWYSIRIRVTDEKVAAWIDNEPVFEVALEGKKISLRPGPIDQCLPLGFANFRTRSAFRNIEMKRIDPTD